MTEELHLVSFDNVKRNEISNSVALLPRPNFVSYLYILCHKCEGEGECH